MQGVSSVITAECHAPFLKKQKLLKVQTQEKFTKLGNILTATVIGLFICLHAKSVKANM